MRKVSKLALVLAAIVSFLFFLVYKIRYDKIYGVLEVLETFGQADKAVSASRQILQPPTWQRVSDNAFVYSGHCTRLPGSDDICPALTVLAVASLETNDLQKMTCQLWYNAMVLRTYHLWLHSITNFSAYL